MSLHLEKVNAAFLKQEPEASGATSCEAQFQEYNQYLGSEIEMSSLRDQVNGIIETCRTVLAGKGKDQSSPVDGTTVQIARAALEAAQVPNDKVLAAVRVEDSITWTGLLAAMETVERTLPLPQPRKRPFSR